MNEPTIDFVMRPQPGRLKAWLIAFRAAHAVCGSRAGVGG